MRTIRWGLSVTAALALAMSTLATVASAPVAAQVANLGTPGTCVASYNWSVATGITGSGLCLGSEGLVPVTLGGNGVGLTGCPTDYILDIYGPTRLLASNEWQTGGNQLGGLGSLLPTVQPTLRQGVLYGGGVRNPFVLVGGATVVGTERCTGAASISGTLLVNLL